ncbi:hypothetical protein K1719_029643 [Acacia pycnantha]|nr:hypothetical protein K1719_029643 [Acacia pycnantha]
MPSGSAFLHKKLRLQIPRFKRFQDGFIMLFEFVDFCRSNSADGDSTELRDAFDLHDRNKDGLISASELHQVLNRLGLKCSVGECKNMIKAVDADGDGSVNLEWFKKMMTNNPLSATKN